MIKDLQEITENLIKAKDNLDKVERLYAETAAKKYFVLKDNYTNQDARERALIIVMEEDEHKLVDALYEARSIARTLSLRRELMLERLKEKRANSL